MKPKECSTVQEPETFEQSEEIKSPSKDKEVHQKRKNEQGKVIETELLVEPEPLNGRILVDTSAWCQGDVMFENVLYAEKDEKTYRLRSPDKDSDFNLDRSVDSFHIDSTEAIIQQKAEVLCETHHVSPEETQKTVNSMAVMKTK